MIFFFVVDPEEGKIFPNIDIPADLGPDYISVLGAKVTEDEVKAHGSEHVAFDADADDLLVLDGKAGDVFAYFFHMPAFKDVIAVMPKRTFNDKGGRVIFSYDADSHFQNAINKLAPSIRLSGADLRTITTRGVNTIPAGQYTVDLVYSPMPIADGVSVEAVHVESGTKSSGTLDFSRKGLYIVTVGGTAEKFFAVTGSVVKTGFTYIVYAE